MRDDRGGGERERGRKHKRHAKDAVRDVRRVGVSDDDDPSEPKHDADRSGGGELLIGGDEARERRRHDGNETQQNSCDTAGNVLLTRKEERMMGADREGATDEHVNEVIHSSGVDASVRDEDGSKQQCGSDVESYGREWDCGQIGQSNVGCHERRSPDSAQEQETTGRPVTTHS